MAEAHSAVAFSFNVTPEGVLDVRYNREAIKAVWYSGIRSWKLRIIRFKNHLVNTLFPSPPVSLILISGLVTALQLYSGVDLSLGLVDRIRKPFPECIHNECRVITAFAFGLGVWALYVLVRRYSLKLMLLNHSWMYEPHGKISFTTKVWISIVSLLKGRHPLLYSYQAALPRLPVPSLESTHRRYLDSVRPLLNDDDYNHMVKLADEFFGGLGKKLQRYLIVKSWWATNYVSDWWEQYVYLRGRSPIMVNSNYYGLDALFIEPTKIQAARAANMAHAFLLFKDKIDHESLEPIMVNKTIPLCSQQYERLFNTCRLPGLETDAVVQTHGCNFITVYNRGRYFKVYTHYNGQLLKPRQFEHLFQLIIDDKSQPFPGEETLAALTAGERVPWAKARKEFFSYGVNKVSLSAIETSCFVLALDDEEQEYDPNDPSKLDQYAKTMLHGKCYDRWFDKSFNLIITKNGRVGFNAEHSWADAPIFSQLWEYSFYVSHLRHGYAADGHCHGEIGDKTMNPIRLQWDIPAECQAVIERSLEVARNIANDVDMHVEVVKGFGKGVMKKCRISPDAFIQLSLQLAYYRDAGKFCLTYESAMTRLFREGRTETVRSCTNESAAFARAVDSGTFSKPELLDLLKKASERHQAGYRDAMTGKGIDRHLFCLYLVSKYLNQESPFLQKVLSEPWRLSTSQTPHTQMNLSDADNNPDHVCAGGGFGPVSNDGYGVSYIVAGENCLFFHISSKVSCPTTDSKRFALRILKAMNDIKEICEK